jgi:hypothetical protein
MNEFAAKRQAKATKSVTSIDGTSLKFLEVRSISMMEEI